MDFYGISPVVVGAQHRVGRDTAGAERYESMSRIYYRGAKAALICYDMTDEESFSKVKFWLSELTENEPECALYVVGTKGKFFIKSKYYNDPSIFIVIITIIIIIILMKFMLLTDNKNSADKLTSGGERGVSALEARNFATQHGARYHETSSATGKGIVELFEDVAAHFVAQRAGLASPKSGTASGASASTSGGGGGGGNATVNLNEPRRGASGKANGKASGAASNKKATKAPGGGCCE